MHESRINKHHRYHFCNIILHYNISNRFFCLILVPELFYLPELFYNYNNLNLGTINIEDKETILNDVEMPKWANGNGYIFM